LTHYDSFYPSIQKSIRSIKIIILLITTLLDTLQFELVTVAALVVILRSKLITIAALLVIVRSVTIAALVTASSIPITSLIGLIPQISSFACIRALVLEVGLEKLFDSPAVRELL
jgi:hypothetical protein